MSDINEEVATAELNVGRSNRNVVSNAVPDTPNLKYAAKSLVMDNRWHIDLSVLDKNGNHFKGSHLDYYTGDDHAEFTIEDETPQIRVPPEITEVKLVASYKDEVQSATVSKEDPRCTIRFTKYQSESEQPMWRSIAIFAFGVIFVGTILAISIFIPNPTPTQYETFRIILALSAAAVATLLTGFIDVEIPGYVKAGGALAVFAVVYFFVPAAIKPPTTGSNELPGARITSLGSERRHLAPGVEVCVSYWSIAQQSRLIISS